MNPQEAYNYIYREVYAPSFFVKLAEAGIHPRNEEEALSFLRMGAKLSAAEQQGLCKDASASALSEAEQALDNVLQSYGLQPSGQEDGIKAAAAQASQHPDLQRAVITLNYGLNQHLAEPVQAAA